MQFSNWLVPIGAEYRGFARSGLQVSPATISLTPASHAPEGCGLKPTRAGCRYAWSTGEAELQRVRKTPAPVAADPTPSTARPAPPVLMEPFATTAHFVGSTAGESMNLHVHCVWQGSMYSFMFTLGRRQGPRCRPFQLLARRLPPHREPSPRDSPISEGGVGVSVECPPLRVVHGACRTVTAAHLQLQAGSHVRPVQSAVRARPRRRHTQTQARRRFPYGREREGACVCARACIARAYLVHWFTSCMVWKQTARCLSAKYSEAGAKASTHQSRS